ncbi:MAG: AAA family ATPase [Chthoniobacterales bacterium]
MTAFLKSPSSYPHAPKAVRAIETHISWVFIVSPFVFKVKKPVNLGFLDFSTLAKRQHFCRRELALNRRLCPEVYLEVIPIYENARGFSFKAEGEIAEYALKMRELEDGWFLRELLEKKSAGEPEINRVISRLHRFYESETPTPEIEAWGSPEKLKISTAENFEQVKELVGETISAIAFETIRHFTNKFYVAKKSLFQERIEKHRIRDCNGDLHLDHIHLTPEATTIFDCIEFGDRFRFIDIANDLAFLAMDFDFEGRRELGKLLLRNAATELRDLGMLKLVDFYKCYRAFVRGKVESLQAHTERAKRYFHLAIRYATAGSESLILVVMGRIGTGKTMVARALASELDWPAFSSDEIRKTLAGLPLRERTAPQLREQTYSESLTKQTYAELVREGLTAAAAHGGAVLDATFSSRARRDFLRTQCAEANIRLQIVELVADDTQIATRLKLREKSAEEISDARLEDFEKLSAAYERPSEVAADLIQISTAGKCADAVKNALLHLADHQAESGTTWDGMVVSS